MVVEHGVGTGATRVAAVASGRDRGAAKVIAAAPAGCSKATWQLHDTADTVVIPHAPSRFKGIEHFYEVFDEVTDHDVSSILHQWAAARTEHHPGVRTLVILLNGQGKNVSPS